MAPEPAAAPTPVPVPPGCVDWRDEPAHAVLATDAAATVYSAAQAATAADAPVVWHSHSFDSIYVMLSAAEATNEIPGPDGTCVCSRIATTPGGVLVYDLMGKPPLVHRVRDNKLTLAFVGVEVALQRLPDDARRLGIAEEVASPLSKAPFASAGRISLQPGVATPLRREKGPGVLPARTVVVAVNGRSSAKDLDASVPPDAKVQKLSQHRLGFRFEILLISHAAHGVVESDAGCVLLNSGKDAWEGIVIDVWGR